MLPEMVVRDDAWQGAFHEPFGDEPSTSGAPMSMQR
jgi:hypothetical protein